LKKLYMLLVFAITGVAATILIVAQAGATPTYAGQTGKTCGYCHVNPAGGGTLTSAGAAFKANGYTLPTTPTAAATTTTTAAATTTTTAPTTTTTAPNTTTTSGPIAPKTNAGANAGDTTTPTAGQTTDATSGPSHGDIGEHADGTEVEQAHYAATGSTESGESASIGGTSHSQNQRTGSGTRIRPGDDSHHTTTTAAHHTTATAAASVFGFIRGSMSPQVRGRD
jgi:hypothetical protein